MRNAGVRPGAACTSTWFARVLGLATALILAAGCTPPGVSRKASGSDAAAPSPADPEAQAMSEVLAGEIAGQSGDLEQAMVHYLRAAELSDDPQLAARATRIAMFAGNPGDAAVQAAQRWLKLDPDSIEAHQTLALLYIRKGETDAAVEHLESVLRLYKGRKGHGYLAIAASLAKEKESSSALEAMRLLVERHAADPDAWQALGILALEAGSPRQALEAANRTLALDPDRTEALVLRADAYQALGDLDAAIRAMRQAVQVAPQDFERRLRLGRLLVQAERYGQARKVFQALLKLRPHDETLLYTLGLLNLQARDLAQARRYFKRLADVGGQRRQEAWFYLGQIAEEQGKVHEALRWYRRIEPGEYFIEARGRMAELLARQGRLDEARAVLARAREQVSSTAEGVRLYLLEGQILRDAKRYEEGMALYNRALTEYPGNEDLLYARAIMAERLGRIDWAERDFKAILAADPDNAAALNALGYTLADHNLRLDEALQYIQKALRLTPNDPTVIDSLGWVYYRMGKLEMAERYLRKAYGLLQDPEIGGHLVEVLWRLGKRREAGNILRELLRAHPDNDALKALRRRLSL